jgi:hypothetical protein
VKKIEHPVVKKPEPPPPPAKKPDPPPPKLEPDEPNIYIEENIVIKLKIVLDFFKN